MAANWVFFSFTVTLAVTSVLGQAMLDRIQADPTDHWLRDPSGRVRLFHGVNSVEKQFPWYSAAYMLNDSRLDDLQDWGLNVVRLGAMWSGVEPSQGHYNTSYLGVLKTIVGKLAARGIHTILDMHQDVMSSRFNLYDGIPRWLVDQYPPPTNPYPWPLDEIGQWEDGYFTQAVSEAFQHFYDDDNSSISLWADFWGVMAHNFTGNSNVLGYNLINEPWIGDYFSDGNLTYPGYAAQRNLVANYDRVHEAIRAADGETLILYEPVFYGQLEEDPVRGSGFVRVPGGAGYESVSAYSFHTYCWPLEFRDQNATDEEVRALAEYCARNFLPRKFDSAYATVGRTGGGLILTEFGICTVDPDDPNIDCDVFMELADQFLVSWVDWDYSDHQFYHPNGSVNEQRVYYYARPYARATAGVPVRQSWNSTTLDFHLDFLIDTAIDISLPTEVFLPRMHYGGGYDVTVSDNLTWEEGPEADVLFLYRKVEASSGELATLYLRTCTSCQHEY